MKSLPGNISGKNNLYRVFFLFSAVLLTLVLLNSCSSFEGSDIDLGYKIYVPNLSDETITVIPAEESSNTTVIDLNSSPQFLARVPNEDVVFALLAGTNQITLINLEDDTVDETITFEAGTTDQVNYRVAFTQDGKKAYFSTSAESAGVAVMKVSDRTFQEAIDVDSTTVNLFFFTPDGSQLYCTDPTLGKIYRINTTSDELVETIDVPESFSVSVFDTSTGRFFMTESGNEAGVKEFDPSSETFVTRIENVVDNVVKLYLLQDENKLYVLGSTELAVLDLEDDTIDEVIALEYSSPTDFKFLPDREYILIPSSSADLVMLLNPDNYNTEDVIDTSSSPGELLIIQDS